MLPDRVSDPFGERFEHASTKRLQLLGAKFRFDSNSAELMHLVDSAYQGLPAHRFPGVPCNLRVTLLLTAQAGRLKHAEPPPLDMISASGLLGGAMQGANFVVISPHENASMVVVCPQMLQFPYHTRYELIEFAVFTLAARAQRLVSLHAACIGQRGRAVLLIGPSGSGKSTVVLHGLLGGLEILSEDSTFISPGTMAATGISNFIHVRANALHWLGKSRAAASIRNSPVIRRRSGVAKFEVDLRRKDFRLAGSPLKIVATVFLSGKAAGRGPLLRPVARASLISKLEETQGYGASQPQWREFRKNVARLTAFELRRGSHPSEAVHALRSILANE